MTDLTAEDHQRVSEAIARAEEKSNGEIIAVTAKMSERYHDAGLQYAVLATFLWLGSSAFAPTILEDLFSLVFGGWEQPSQQMLLSIQLFFALLIFLIVWGAMRSMPLRMALIPGSTKTRRVRKRAIDIYKASAERRTIGRTGILIYLSMAEHRAEIVHDDAITEAVEPDVWAEAMLSLLGPVKEGRIADGLVAAIEDIGDVLAQHFPKSSDDTNEIPDKLIEL